MQNKENIPGELRDISAVIAAIGSNTIYTVPAGYFEQLPGYILQQINEQEDLAAKEVLQQSFTVSPSYFENLADTILSKIKDSNAPGQLPNEITQELEFVAPLLAGISKETLYKVPKHYFEQFRFNIPEEKQPPVVEKRVIKLPGYSRKWLNYAAAAVTVGIIATGIFMYIGSSTKNVSIEKTINNLTDNEIADYLLHTQHPATDIAPLITDEDIDVQSFLDNTSDEEINQYLNQQKQPGEPVNKDI